MKQKILLTALVIISAICQIKVQTQFTNLNSLELSGRYFQLVEAGIAEALGALALVWAFLYFLYRKKIFIKV